MSQPIQQFNALLTYFKLLDPHIVNIHSYIVITVSCLTPKDLKNGMSSCSKDQEYFYEDACNFTCNIGYELTGSNTSTCQSDRSWSGNEAKCERG